MKTKKAPLPVRVIALVLFAVMLVLTCACVWATLSFDNISLEEVLFYLSMPLRGTATQFTRELILFVAVPSVLLFGLLLLLCFWPFRKGPRFLPLRIPMRIAYPLLAVWLAVILPIGNRLLGISDFIYARLNQSTFIEEHYVDPAKVNVTFPEKKRNLITLYVESAETTNQDVENGGLMDINYTPEMTEIAKNNVAFSQNDLLQGAAVAPACGWTVAGMVAQTGGIPLKFFRYDNLTTDNMGKDLVNFLPGATMLGDILKENGYRNVFIVGSDFDFGGRRQLYIQHGGYTIYDYFTAEADGWIPEGYYYGWGYEDKRLYENAKNVLTELAAGDQPFHLGLLTVDTHNPGWLCDVCPQSDDAIYGRVLQCSSRQVGDFVAWCQEQPWYADTTIVITGDHASMTLGFYEDHAAAAYDRYAGSEDRFVYNAFVNCAVQPVQMKNRKFTTMDFFPTVLAAMGASIEGERLGLGTNLFSAAETLSEEYGYDTLFDELRRKSSFYDSKLLR